MAKIHAIFHNDARGIQAMLSDGREVLIPWNLGLSIGDEWPEAPPPIPPGEPQAKAPSLEQLNSPAQVAANILSEKAKPAGTDE
jgi:hypothetical protein